MPRSQRVTGHGQVGRWRSLEPRSTQTGASVPETRYSGWKAFHCYTFLTSLCRQATATDLPDSLFLPLQPLRRPRAQVCANRFSGRSIAVPMRCLRVSTSRREARRGECFSRLFQAPPRASQLIRYLQKIAKGREARACVSWHSATSRKTFEALPI